MAGTSALAGSDDGRRLLADLADLFRQAAGNSNMSHRLARAETTVRFTLAEDPEASVTALLDREPIQVADDGHVAEIELVLPGQILERLFHGDFHLTMAIVRGEATFRGPVRKLLLVMPILQHFAETVGMGYDEELECDSRTADAA